MADGGAILCNGTAGIMMTNCSFSGNTAYSGRGGAVSMNKPASSAILAMAVQAINSTFTRNVAIDGGALYAYRAAA